MAVSGGAEELEAAALVTGDARPRIPTWPWCATSVREPRCCVAGIDGALRR